MKKLSSTRTAWQDISTSSHNTKCYWAQQYSLHEGNDMLYRKWKSDIGRKLKRQLLLQRTRIPDVLIKLHSSSTSGPLEVMKNRQKCRQHCYWSRAKEDVKKMYQFCDACAARKSPKTCIRGKLKWYNIGASFERIALDIVVLQ